MKIAGDKTLISYLCVLLAATIWGSAGPFIKVLSLPPTTVAFFRLAIPTLVLWPYLHFTGRTPRPNRRLLLASGLFAIRILLFVTGFTYASIGSAVIVSYTWPIFITLFAIPMAKQRVDFRSGVLLVLAFAGTLLVYGQPNVSLTDNNFLGLSAILLSAIMLSITHLLFAKELATRSQSEAIFFQNVLGTILFLPFLLINDPFPSIDQFIIGSIYSFLIGLVCFSLFFYGLRHLRVAKTASLAYIEVVSALLFAYWFFDEPATWNKLAGGTLILTAAALVKR